MDNETGKQTDRWTTRQANKQIETQMDSQTGKQTDKWKTRQASRQTDSYEGTKQIGKSLPSKVRLAFKTPFKISFLKNAAHYL